MTRILLLFSSRSATVADALADVFAASGFTTAQRAMPLPPPASATFTQWAAEVFESTAGWISDQTAAVGGPGCLRDVVVYAEFFDDRAANWQDLRALAGADGAPAVAVIAMLVLAFPEIHWMFYSPYDQDIDETMAAAHLLQCDSAGALAVALHAARFAPLFDPTGLRDLIRTDLRRADGGDMCAYLPTRTFEAAAVDEEIDYTYFMAYLLYRAGYRSWAVSSMTLLRWRFTKGHPLALALEDVYLSFPDRALDDGLSDLETRYELFRGLAQVRQRIIITGGQARAGRQTLSRNIRFLKRLGQPFRILYKPLTGVFETSRRAGIRATLAWPPLPHTDSGNVHGHSAPGRLLAIASVLIDRSRQLLASARTVSDAIHAAVLALDAKEILGGRTPTLAFEAVSLQHEAEVLAESLFVGVEHNLDVRSRLRNIAIEVAAVARWVHPQQRTRAILNARLSIVDQIAARYRALGQVEEELACLGESRRLRVDLWTRERPYRWPAWPVLRYFAFALSSLPRFVTLVVLWTLFFGAGYYFFGLAAEKPSVTLGDAFLTSTRAFVTADVADDWKRLPERNGSIAFALSWKTWLTLQGAIAYTNLGLLISHLYMVASRR